MGIEFCEERVYEVECVSVVPLWMKANKRNIQRDAKRYTPINNGQRKFQIP